MGAAKLPVDLILFGLIALFLILRLRSILGRRTGFEAMPEMLPRAGAPPIIEGRAEPVAAAASRPMPDPASPTGQGLAAIRAADKKFDPSIFLSGAENAFRLIVIAFAAGDRAKLQPLLTPEIRSILEATIEDATLQGSVADITVRFVSHQISVTLASDSSIVAGADAITELADIWTFSRDLKQPQPAWKLASARSA
jgi:predicted lipid-binding transport protein (Tim44 family)